VRVVVREGDGWWRVVTGGQGRALPLRPPPPMHGHGPHRRDRHSPEGLVECIRNELLTLTLSLTLSLPLTLNLALTLTLTLTLPLPLHPSPFTLTLVPCTDSGLSAPGQPEVPSTTREGPKPTVSAEGVRLRSPLRRCPPRTRAGRGRVETHERPWRCMSVRGDA